MAETRGAAPKSRVSQKCPLMSALAEQCAKFLNSFGLYVVLIQTTYIEASFRPGFRLKDSNALAHSMVEGFAKKRQKMINF